jgi:hypothetical protein
MLPDAWAEQCAWSTLARWERLAGFQRSLSLSLQARGRDRAALLASVDG